MFNTCNTYLKKPELYEKTRDKFWNDDHISKGMLEAHLDPTIEAASRKPEVIASSARWISTLLPQGAKIIDIGCGPGLYTKQFSDLGLQVTGLDFSERSIAFAKENDSKSQYVLMDYLEMSYENAFDMITLIWCDFGALIPKDRQNLLDRIYLALKPEGLFLLDVFTPKYNAERKENTSWEVFAQGGFWSSKPHVCLSAEYYYGENIGVGRTVIIEEEEILGYNIWNTCFTKESLFEEIQPHGLTAVDYYSNVEGKPNEESSKTLCAVFKKKIE